MSPTTAASPAPATPAKTVVNHPPVARVATKPTGFGLPCSKCKTYYAANLKTCPVCKSTERVEIAPPATPGTHPLSEETPSLAVLEREREKFLREFKAQMFTSQMHLQRNAHSNCSQKEKHHGEPQPAAVCQDCYDHLQQRLDVLEAALHIDVKEAAQLVYEAVWADTSDSGRTYENAAHALLSEIRKRAGVSQNYGTAKPVSD